MTEVCLPASIQKAPIVNEAPCSSGARGTFLPQPLPSECHSLRSRAVGVLVCSLNPDVGASTNQKLPQVMPSIGVAPALDQASSRIELRSRNRLSKLQVPGNTIVHVRDGVLALEATPAGGRRQILDFLMPGDVFPGSFSVTVPGLFLRALTKTILDKDFFAASKGITERCVETAGLLRMLSSLLTRHSLHQIMIGQLDSPSRVSSFLLMLALRCYPALGSNLLLPLPMSRDDIADYLAMNSDTLSRIMKRLESLRVIRRVNRHTLNLIDPQRLGQLSPICSLLFTALGSTASNDTMITESAVVGDAQPGVDPINRPPPSLASWGAGAISAGVSQIP